MKSKSLVLMVLSLGFGLVAAIGISQVMGGKNTVEAPVVPKKTVLVAAANLEHNAFLKEDLVRVEEWPLEIIPENAATSLDQIKDQATRQPLSKGMPIILTTLIHQKLANTDIPEGFQVFSVKISAEDTGHGMLQPGHKVNMIGHVPGKPTKTFLRGLRIHSVNAQTTAQKKEEGGSGSDAVVGILVNERQAELIYQVQKGGTVKIVLRGDHISDADKKDGLDEEGIASLGLNGEIPESRPIPGPVVQHTPSAPSPIRVSKTMKIWSKEGVEEVTFRDGLVVSPGPIDRYRPAVPQPLKDLANAGKSGKAGQSASKDQDDNEDSRDSDDSEESEDSDPSDDHERGLEEDKY